MSLHNEVNSLMHQTNALNQILVNHIHVQFGHNDEEIEDSASSDSSSSSRTPQSKLNLLDISTGSFRSIAMPIMTTNMLAMEEQLVVLTKTIEVLCKAIEDRDVQMASMMNKIESMGESNQAADNPPKL
ncbi:hypothetical protein Acr_04g0002320 [Actinidia rufa]|uniref:Uncharacterized protein n=1 Tax=Actinidia rufa TaxID=165716 RepID=A0A7J0EG88_9ERIC|nr:hypothetical protein Acr_04g0002320 [Actinidia rufa]